MKIHITSVGPSSVLPALGISTVCLIIKRGNGVLPLAQLSLLGTLACAPVLQPLVQVPFGALSLAGNADHLSHL